MMMTLFCVLTKVAAALALMELNQAEAAKFWREIYRQTSIVTFVTVHGVEW